jgi:hypothetical protein
MPCRAAPTHPPFRLRRDAVLLRHPLHEGEEDRDLDKAEPGSRKAQGSSKDACDDVEPESTEAQGSTDKKARVRACMKGEGARLYQESV